jgi:hypothetical protein
MFTPFSNCLNSALSSIHNRNACYIDGVILDSFLGVFKKNRALCIDLIQSGPPSLLENLIQCIDHPAVLHRFLTIFNDTVSEAVDFLVWHFLLLSWARRTV